jgi:hypothetical protein
LASFYLAQSDKIFKQDWRVNWRKSFSITPKKSQELEKSPRGLTKDSERAKGRVLPQVLAILNSS